MMGPWRWKWEEREKKKKTQKSIPPPMYVLGFVTSCSVRPSQTHPGNKIIKMKKKNRYNAAMQVLEGEINKVE